MKAIYLKELRTYFKSPLGYVFIGVLLIIFGFYYSVYTLYRGYSEYGTYVLSSVMSVVMFIIPLLTMRIFTEETKNKTDQMLLTAPVNTWGIVLGKYFAALTVLALALVLTMLQPLTTALGYGGDVGISTVIGGYIGIFVLSASLISIGVLISSLTENQLIAVVLTLGLFILMNMMSGIESVLPSDAIFSMVVTILVLAVVLFLLYRALQDIFVCGIIGVAGLAVILALYFIVPSVFEGLVGTVLGWLNIIERCSEIFTGVFNFSQIIFFITFTVFFLFMTVQVLEKKRWS
jgi:ABC-2 type transport system permease protein